jgi:hypothetical protein
MLRHIHCLRCLCGTYQPADFATEFEAECASIRGDSNTPTPQPSRIPSPAPTTAPTPHPSAVPTAHPTAVPTRQPSPHPTPAPSIASAPTSQPTGIPTSQPTTYPTLPLEAVISINISHTFREVSATKFNKQKRKCVHALADGFAEILDLPPRESFQLHGKAVEYFNQIYDYDFLSVRENPDASTFMALGNLSNWNNYTGSTRRLGQTHGSVGTTLHYTLYIDTSRLGLIDTDEAYWNTKKDLLESLERHVFLDVMRVKASNTGCAALAAIEGSTITYFSNDYLSTQLHTAYPTSMPTITPRVRRPYNFDGIIAGTIVGITAFVTAGMILLHFKYILGFDKPFDRFNDEPAIEL